MEEKNIELTEEMREKLLKSGVLGYQIEAKFPYVPRAFIDNGLPKKLWTVFFLKSSDGVESAEIEDLQRGDFKYESVENEKVNGMSMSLNSAKARIETLRRCLVGWKNFRDTKGKLIEDWEKDLIHDGASESSIRYIHPDLQVELCNAIENQKMMNDEELLGLEL